MGKVFDFKKIKTKKKKFGKKGEIAESKYIAALRWHAGIYAKLGWKMIPLHAAINGVCTCRLGSECKAPGKHPRPRGWQTIATDNLKTVEKWIKKLGRKLNLGIATGAPSGVSILDVDPDKGGIDSLEQLEDEYGPLPETLRAITGSGGAHIAFASIPGRDIVNKVKILPGLDIRDKGGLIVVAPSIHYKGDAYQWVNIETELADYPEWLLDLIDGRKSSRFDFVKWLERQPPAIEGENGSAACMRVAAKAVRAAKIRSFDVFKIQVSQWNKRCEPPWNEAELEHKFNDALASWKEEGRADIPTNKYGEYRAGFDSIVQILREDSLFQDSIRYNEAIQDIYRNDKPLGSKGVNKIRYEIMQKYNHMPVPKEDLKDALLLIGHENAFNPIQDYLTGLKWDGKPRINKVLKKILRAKVSTLNQLYIRKWFIACVARAMKPGCKMQTALVLKSSAQGTYKSTFFEELARPWFVDSQIDLKNKDTYGIIGKAWIYEWSEIETVYTSREVSRVKSFISSREDVYREPYGSVTEAHPRHTVCVGTTNKDEILHDPTGSRRFWIIEILGLINFKLLLKWKDQLWAEAYARYDSGETWWLSKKTEKIQQIENELYRTESPLNVRTIELSMKMLKEAKRDPKNKHKGILLVDLARRLGVDLVRNVQAQNEITSTLRSIGFKQTLFGKFRIRIWAK